MTTECCIVNSAKVASIKPKLAEKIIYSLLNLENSKKYPEKQKALMMSFIIEGFENLINNFPDINMLLDFAKRHLSSISPKTRKTAKMFVKKYS